MSKVNYPYIILSCDWKEQMSVSELNAALNAVPRANVVEHDTGSDTVVWVVLPKEHATEKDAKKAWDEHIADICGDEEDSETDEEY